MSYKSLGWYKDFVALCGMYIEDLLKTYVVSIKYFYNYKQVKTSCKGA